MDFFCFNLVLNKVASFPSEAHIFLYQKKLGINFNTGNRNQSLIDV